MLTERQKRLLRQIPKAENHIHIEGSIPWDLALQLAERNHVELPYKTVEQMGKWAMEMIAGDGLNGFMICDRTFNSVCLHERDYEDVVLALAKNDAEQNIIYQELHLDYPLNEERGIPIEVVMEGYRSAQKKAKELYGVEIVYIGGLDRTLSSEQCLNFVRQLENYRDMVAGIGMDCEERGHPCIKHLESYREAKRQGFFLTAHAGEDGSDRNIWDALLQLQVDRIDHGCRAAENPELMQYLAEHDILLAMCPYGNVLGGAAKSFEEHPFRTLLHAGVPVSISTDDPPYCLTMIEELETDMEKMHLTEQEMVKVIRNGFAYGIDGKKYLPMFDAWVKAFYEKPENMEDGR